MNRKTSKGKLYRRFTLYTVTSLLLSIIFSSKLNAQITHATQDETAICNISVYKNTDGNDSKKPNVENRNASVEKGALLKKKFQFKSNQFGLFPRITVFRAFEVVPIEVIYPNAKNGDKIVLNATDGGHFDNGKNVKVVETDNQKKCVFNFRVTDQQGLFRIFLRKGADTKVVQLWVSANATTLSESSDPNSLLSAAATSPSATDPCRNNSEEGPCTWCGELITCPGPNKFHPYTGNVYRSIRDLEVWGSVGEIPLVWMRYFNSRGGTHIWNYSFHFRMFNEGSDSHGQPIIVIQYPEGGENKFTRDIGNPNTWLPFHGVDKYLFQEGNNFFLQMANGHRYRFEKLTDESGNPYYRLQDFRDSHQNLYTLRYNTDNTLWRIIKPGGRFLQITYDVIHSTGVISQVSTNDGRQVKYMYDVHDDGINPQIRLTGVLYGDGTQASYTYSQSEPGALINLEHAIDSRYEGIASNIIYKYSDNNAFGFVKEERNGITGKVMATLTIKDDISEVCYPNGRVQIYNMPSDLLGKVKDYTDGLGRKTQLTYDKVRITRHANDPGGVGFVLTETDALGRVTTYNRRTIYGNPLEITHPDGSKEKWTRDDLDFVLTYTDELGRLTIYTRDNRHRITRIRYPDRTIERFTYNNFGQVLTHTLRNGGVERNVYNNRGLKIRFIDALGNITMYGYDGADRLASVIDARGNTIRYEYNERGLLTKMTNADNSFQRYTYDNLGNRTSITNEIANTWTTLYDEFKRPVNMRDPLNRATAYSYDLPGGACGCSHDNNNPTQITLPSGRITSIEYDVEWQKIKETVGAGTAYAATTSFEYDLVGNLETIFDPRLKSWAYEYDLRDRRKSSTDPLGNKTQLSYDFAGNALTERRPDNGITTNMYDVMDRQIQSTNPNGEITKMVYDEEGNLLVLTDAKNNSYQYEYDLLDRRTKMIYPDGSFEGYTYDPVSNLKTYKTRAGQIRTYTYDSRNREILSDWNDATPDISRTYDLASRLLTLSSSVSVLTFNYSNANELTSETQNITGGNGAKTVVYEYNPDGLRSVMSNPNGTVVNYDYTGRNQVRSIKENGNVLTTYTYDLNGNRIGKALTNGTNTFYAYDAVSRVLTLDNQKAGVSFARFDYGYDNVNRRTFVQGDRDKGDVFKYDAIDQLTYVQYGGFNQVGTPQNRLRTVEYKYDATGNRESHFDTDFIVSYSSNNLNQYTSVAERPLVYDVNGNLETFNNWNTHTVWTYTYDAQNRLIKAGSENTTVLFAYDARNRCVKRTINGVVTLLYHDGWNLIEEYNSSSLPITLYIHGAQIDEILSKTTTSNTVLYHYDALGSVTQLTGVDGNVVERYAYDVFGAPSVIGRGILGSAFGNRFMFTGREYINEIGLYDYRNRMYSAELGRFLQVDPIRFDADDINVYRYVANNPINYIDPLGLEECEPGTIQWISLTLWHNVKSYKSGKFKINIPGGAIFYMEIKYKCCVCVDVEKNKWKWSEERTDTETLVTEAGGFEVWDVGSINKVDLSGPKKEASKELIRRARIDCGGQ